MKSKSTLHKNKRSIIVIGANGFLGTNFMQRINSDFNAIGIVKSIQNGSEFDKVNRAFYAMGDLEDILRDENLNVAAIINCAVKYRGSEKELHLANVELPKNLVALCESYRIHQLFLFDSFYSFSKLKYSHLSAYTTSKIKAREEISKMDLHDTRIEWVILGHLFGENDGNEKFVPSLLKSLLKNKTIDLTNGEQERDFVYVGCVVNSILSNVKARQKRQGLAQTYLGSQRTKTIRSFVEKCHNLSGSESQLNFGALEYRDNEIMKPFTGDTHTEAFPLVEETEFDKALMKTIEFYRYVD